MAGRLIAYNNCFITIEEFEMSDNKTKPELPDRLSGNPRSPHHNEEIFKHNIGILFNGKQRNDVEEYCISEGWVKVSSAKALDRKGQPLLITLNGTVEPFYS